MPEKEPMKRAPTESDGKVEENPLDFADARVSQLKGRCRRRAARSRSVLEHECRWIHDETRAESLIAANHESVHAHMSRALARRLRDDLEGSLADYCRVIRLDPGNAYAWMGRGAILSQMSSRLTDHQLRRSVMDRDVYPSYLTAACLDPADAEIGLSLLEVEVIVGRFSEAICTAGLWWGRQAGEKHKTICAWLGSIASILAGKPSRKWAKYEEYLRISSVRLGELAWCTEEMRNFLEDLQSSDGCSPERLARVMSVHELFLLHFGSEPIL